MAERSDYLYAQRFTFSSRLPFCRERFHYENPVIIAALPIFSRTAK